MDALETLGSLRGNTRRVADFLLAHDTEYFTGEQLAKALGLKRPPYAALGTLVRLGIADREDENDGDADHFMASEVFVRLLQEEEESEAADVSMKRRRPTRRAPPPSVSIRVVRPRERIGCFTWLVVLLGLGGVGWVAWLIYESATAPPVVAPAPSSRPSAGSSVPTSPLPAGDRSSGEKRVRP